MLNKIKVLFQAKSAKPIKNQHDVESTSYILANRDNIRHALPEAYKKWLKQQITDTDLMWEARHIGVA